MSDTPRIDACKASARTRLREPEDGFDRDYDFIITRHIAGRIADTIGPLPREDSSK